MYIQNSVILGFFCTPLKVPFINFEVIDEVTGPPTASRLSGSTFGPK